MIPTTNTAPAVANQLIELNTGRHHVDVTFVRFHRSSCALNTPAGPKQNDFPRIDLIGTPRAFLMSCRTGDTA